MQRCLLREATVAFGFDESGRRVVVTVPTGPEITATDIVPLEPTKDHTEQINVTWDGRPLTMFLTDLQRRGERVHSAIEWPSGFRL
jgi:hypothetical protein